jgi:hypothetical protein
MTDKPNKNNIKKARKLLSKFYDKNSCLWGDDIDDLNPIFELLDEEINNDNR